MRSQVITKEVKTAIQRWYRESNLTQTQIANLLGVKNPSVNAWLNGNAKTIRPRNWAALYPHIKEYLPADFDPEENEDAPPARTRTDPLLLELQKLWPKLSLSEKSRVLTFTAELLEKQGGPLQPQILDKVN